MTIKAKLVRLAHANPTLRPHLLPIIRSAKVQGKPNQPVKGNPDRYEDGTIFYQPGSGRGYRKDPDAPIRQRYVPVKRRGDSWVDANQGAKPLDARSLMRQFESAPTTQPYVIGKQAREKMTTTPPPGLKMLVKAARWRKLSNGTYEVAVSPLNMTGAVYRLTSSGIPEWSWSIEKGPGIKTLR